MTHACGKFHLGRVVKLFPVRQGDDSYLCQGCFRVVTDDELAAYRRINREVLDLMNPLPAVSGNIPPKKGKLR